MAVTNTMFLFEVVVQSVKSKIENGVELIIRSDFADIFSLELKDPKQMHIVMPEPLPLPPEPPGKKGKKKPKPKDKKKKKGQIEAPPPEPVIQSGQSVLFSSSAEVLIQNMKKSPLQLSLWNKEDYLVHIGSISIPWDPIFLKYLEGIAKCQDTPSVTLNEEYNIFEEGMAKIIAQIGIQVKLSYLGDKVTTAFRTLSEDPIIKKVLYTGVNSKTTSYMCTIKTTDETFEENCNKIENNFIVDKPKLKKIAYADYKNAPGAKLNMFNDGDYCCMNNADKPPDSIYKAPETCPDVDFIVDYIRKIISSCNDNMRMLTPRPTIKPRVKATDIDRLCYCKVEKWPDNEFSQRFKKEVQSEPCPKCITAAEKQTAGNQNATIFDAANIRGPCGRPDCRIARDLRAYIENLIEEDAKEIDINKIIGPCGSKECSLAEKIQQFLRQEGIFNRESTKEGLSTQCACIEQMLNEFTKKKSCDTVCSKDCESSDSEKSSCDGKGCPFGKSKQVNKVYDVYYFFVEYDFDKKSGTPSGTDSNKSITFPYCDSKCPSAKPSEKTFCSKSVCSVSSHMKSDKRAAETKCDDTDCLRHIQYPPSPADSHIVINFDDITNPCCVKSCNVVDVVKDLIVRGTESKKVCDQSEDPCYCDCDCTFKFSKNTTYCAVCSGYECLGDDMKDLREHAKPHPCPIYNKLYDKNKIKVPSPWPEQESMSKHLDNLSLKSSKEGGSKIDRKRNVSRSVKSFSDRGSDRKSSRRLVKKSDKKTDEKKKTEKVTTKKTGSTKNIKKLKEKSNDQVEKKSPTCGQYIPESKYPYPPVPKHMGWMWDADDIPGMKPRPKWKPGAANKILVRRYRAVREGVDIIAKKKRALLQRKRKLEMKPTLVVKKQDGEYTVQMEVFKKYSKERMVFQYPYDEKPPLIYSIGKTEEEKRKIQKQRERKERRETKRKCRLLQSTFRNKCQEICLKAYNQAIGLLPLPDPNSPDCPCHTEDVKNLSPPIESCSCSDDERISSSDTDGDDWVIEFTPPLARWDPKVKHPPVLTENECQYNYLDYKVKLLDKSGNPVPRFFKGPDGKQECSDLGGFWSPDHVWMEINKDGYIGPDNRWVPMNFTGPDGMFYSAEEGFFTDNTGKTLKIGVDGYIDKDNKWAWYSNRKFSKSVKSKTLISAATADSKKNKIEKSKEAPKRKTEPHVKVAISATTRGKGEKKQAPAARDKAQKVLSSPRKGQPLIMSVSVDHVRNKSPQDHRIKCTMDPRRLEKYQEIMECLNAYDDFVDLQQPVKTNRASNTLKKSLSPFTLRKCPPVLPNTLELFQSVVNESKNSSGTPLIM